LLPGVQPTASIFSAAGVPVISVSEETLGIVVRVEAGDVEDALNALVADGYDFLVDLLGSDTGEQLEVTYNVRCLADMRQVFVKTNTPYDGEVPSVWQVFPAALFPEREAAELFGMTFFGHPNPKRLLTSDDVEGLYMLRKSCLVRTEEEVTLLGDYRPERES
jgi:NADH:ubiquinone oxidoreductase subunit C